MAKQAEARVHALRLAVLITSGAVRALAAYSRAMP